MTRIYPGKISTPLSVPTGHGTPISHVSGEVSSRQLEIRFNDGMGVTRTGPGSPQPVLVGRWYDGRHGVGVDGWVHPSEELPPWRDWVRLHKVCFGRGSSHHRTT